MGNGDGQRPRLAEVHTLYEANALDIPAMARLLANNVDAGKFGNVRSAAVVLEREDGVPEVFSWGDSGLLRTIGLLHLGIHKLTTMRGDQ